MPDTTEESTSEIVAQFDSVMHFIAQAAINITEGHTNIEEGSPIHHAMIKLCQLVNDNKVGVRADTVTITRDDAISAIATMRAILKTTPSLDKEFGEGIKKTADRIEAASKRSLS